MTRTCGPYMRLGYGDCVTCREIDSDTATGSRVGRAPGGVEGLGLRRARDHHAHLRTRLRIGPASPIRASESRADRRAARGWIWRERGGRVGSVVRDERYGTREAIESLGC